MKPVNIQAQSGKRFTGFTPEMLGTVDGFCGGGGDGGGVGGVNFL